MFADNHEIQLPIEINICYLNCFSAGSAGWDFNLIGVPVER